MELLLCDFQEIFKYLFGIATKSMPPLFSVFASASQCLAILFSSWCPTTPGPQWPCESAGNKKKLSWAEAAVTSHMEPWTPDIHSRWAKNSTHMLACAQTHTDTYSQWSAAQTCQMAVAQRGHRGSERAGKLSKVTHAASKRHRFWVSWTLGSTFQSGSSQTFICTQSPGFLFKCRF